MSIFLTLLSPYSAFGSFAAKAPKCSEIFVSPDFNRISEYEKEFEVAREAQPRLFAALTAFIADAKRENLKLPPHLLETSDPYVKLNRQFALQWFKKLEKKFSEWPRLKVKNSAVLEMSGGASEVYIINDSASTKVVFRPLKENVIETVDGRDENQLGGGNITVGRKTFLAFYLNRLLKLKTVPEAWFGFLNGEPGVFSEYIPHEMVETAWDYDVGKTIVPGYRKFYDLKAFEFLVGNWEASWGPNLRSRTSNSFSDESGRLVPPLSRIVPVVIDHDPAFIPGIIQFTLNHAAGVGTQLPIRYCKSFIKSLEALTPEVLTKHLQGQMTSIEIQGLLFRRALILKDVEIQGASILLDSL